MGEYDVMSLSQYRDWLADRNRTRSMAELRRRCESGQFGRKIGRDWLVSFADAERSLAKVPEDSSR